MPTARFLLAGLALMLGFRPIDGDCRASDEKLRLTSDMIINETGLGDASLAVDEQEAVGDPATKPEKRPERAYLTGWKDWMFPAHLILDVGPDQSATRLLIFNDTGKHAIRVATGTPTHWSEPREWALDRYREWHEISLGKPTRYVRITFVAPTPIPEIVAHGTRREAPRPPEPPRTERPARPTFDQFLGTNAFIDDPIDKLTPIAGTLREYHGWGWDVEHPDHQIRFQPSGAAGGNSWFFDDYYAKLHAAGVVVSPCIQQSLPWKTGNPDRDAKPAAQGADPADPASYADHAAHLYQFAARYGRNEVPDAMLTLAPDQPRKSGLGTIRFFENANEPDKDWKGRAPLSTPFELAAQCSADCDGHRGALGPGHGVRAADPGAKLVMAGLYRDPLTYLDAMRFWAEHHRGGSFPADVINVHHYCGDGDAQQHFKTRGVSPEDGEFRQKMAKIVTWRDRHVPSAEVWVTEFGYDTHPGSPLHAPAIGSLSPEVVQAAWLARSEFLLAAAGIDRALMFMFRDGDEGETGVFASSGLVTGKGRWEPKPSWFFQATLKEHLAGFRWDADVPSGREGVAVMRFVNGDRTALAAWCTTSEDRRERGVRLSIPGSRARLIELAAGERSGRASDLAAVDGAVTIDVTEVPALILSIDP